MPGTVLIIDGTAARRKKTTTKSSQVGKHWLCGEWLLESVEKVNEELDT